MFKGSVPFLTIHFIVTDIWARVPSQTPSSPGATQPDCEVNGSAQKGLDDVEV